MSLLAVAAAAASRAQTAPPDGAAPSADGNVLPEIIVTAQKRTQPIEDVPMSISAATGTQMQNMGIASAADLSKIASSFTYTTSNYGAPIYAIRGIGFYDEAIGAAPTVTVYVDQVPLPFSRMAEGAMLDVQRVEVLEGPQGTLFGQNSTGGAINYIANKPTDQLEAGGTATYGRFGEADLESFVSGGITENLQARFALQTEQRGDWQQDLYQPSAFPGGFSGQHTATNGARNFDTARLLVDWEPSNTVKFELSANGWLDRSDSQAPMFVTYSPTTPTSLDVAGGTGYLGSAANPNLASLLKSLPQGPNDDQAAGWPAGLNLQRDDSFKQLALHGDWRVADNVTLTSISSFSGLHVRDPNELAGTPFLNYDNIVYGDIQSYSQELRLSGASIARELRWMIGGNYQHDEIQDHQLGDLDSTNNGVGPYRFSDFINLNNQNVSTPAVFGSLDYSVTAALTLQGSVRYTHSKRVFNGCAQDTGDGQLATSFGFLSNLLHGISGVPSPGSPYYIPPGACVTFASNSDPVAVSDVYKQANESNTSWRGGASYRLSEDAMVYGNVTRGFKSGSFGTLPILTASQVNLVLPEEVTAYEIGSKLSAFHRAAELSDAIFYYDYKNKQLLGSYDSGAIFGILPTEVNIPKSRVEGAELGLKTRLARGLTASLGATYVASRVTSHFDAYSPVSGEPPVDIYGEAFPNTPKWNVTGDAEYDFPLPHVQHFTGFVGGTYTYRTATTSVVAAPEIGTPELPPWGAPGDFNVPAYGLLDLRMGIESLEGTWRVQLWAKNVTDKYYWTFADRNEDTVVRQNGMPATFGVTVSGRY